MDFKAEQRRMAENSAGKTCAKRYETGSYCEQIEEAVSRFGSDEYLFLQDATMSLPVPGPLCYLVHSEQGACLVGFV